MPFDYQQLRGSDGCGNVEPGAGHGLAAGKRTLTEQAGEGVPVQRKPDGSEPGAEVHEAAQRGVAGPGSALPHLDTIQRAFGRHDVQRIEAHTGGEAQQASRAMGASAFATGNHVAFGAAPDLHTAAHEAAHVVQQRAGVQLKGGVGAVGDAYERHADKVADTVVAGHSAQGALDEMAGPPTTAAGGAVQRQEGNAGGGPTPADIAAVRAKLAAARALLADKSAPLDDNERKQLEATIVNAELALRSYDDLAGQGQSRTAMMAPLALAGGGIAADDVTGVGVADDPLLILVGIGMLATLLLTRAPASDQQLAQSWSNVITNLVTVAAAGTTLVALKINGDRLRGNTGQLAVHLARLLALASVAGVPSGEPPKNNNDNDPHWWKEIKAFLKNIQSAIGDASRKQVLRELGKKFTEEQILEIERLLAEAAKRMGEPPPPFLPPP
jgi:hypothetical protein